MICWQEPFVKILLKDSMRKWEVNIAHGTANNLMQFLPTIFSLSDPVCPLTQRLLPSSFLLLSLFPECPHGGLSPPFSSLSNPILSVRVSLMRVCSFSLSCLIFFHFLYPLDFLVYRFQRSQEYTMGQIQPLQ